MDVVYARRKYTERIVQVACVFATLVAILPLASIVWFVASQGIWNIDWAFFTQLPKPVGEDGGGLGNAVIGTLTLVGIACAVGIPVGVATGVYLAEFGDGRLGRLVRFSADVMSGIPSIVIGIFVYTVMVVPMHKQSALAGGVALAILMLPTISRATEELLLMVPGALREAALALGVPKWRAAVRVVLRTAAPGIATAVMLAVARATGETAPLLFTAGNNRYWADGLIEPTSSLTVQIYQYAVSPYDDWHQKAWAASLVLVGFIIVLNGSARLLVRNRLVGR